MILGCIDLRGTHLVHLQQTLQLLRENFLFAKLSKCNFGRTKIKYLGHIISHSGIAIDPKKVGDVLQWPIPTSPKSLRGFLGLIGYYCKFIKGYGGITKPLIVLLKKDAFQWNDAASHAFSKLKEALTTASVLHTQF